MNFSYLDWRNMEKFARKCDVTGEGMNEGWVAYDGEMYFANEGDALKWCVERGYKDIDEAYEDDVIYWTDWYGDESDWMYIQNESGELVEIENL
jgi:hypothetical protein